MKLLQLFVRSLTGFFYRLTHRRVGSASAALPVRRRVANPVADERRKGIVPGRSFVRLIGTGIVGLMMFGLAFASSDWFAAPPSIDITIEGKIGSTVKTFGTQSPAQTAGGGVTSFDAATSESITCEIQTSACPVFIAVKLDANPAGATRTLTFGCAADSGFTCTSNNAATFTSPTTTGWAKITITGKPSGTEDATLAITGTWS